MHKLSHPIYVNARSNKCFESNTWGPTNELQSGHPTNNKELVYIIYMNNYVGENSGPMHGDRSTVITVAGWCTT